MVQSAFCEKIVFSAEEMSGKAGDKNTVTVLNGKAKVRTSSMEISADRIELSGKELRKINASGGIKGRNLESEIEFTCGKLSYDRVTKIAVLENDVNLIDEKNSVNAKAGFIEYDQDKEIAVMQLHVEILQKENVCKSVMAVYRMKDQILDMSGNPQIEQKDDLFKAQSISLDMNTQKITLSGRVSGSVKIEGVEADEEDVSGKDNPEKNEGGEKSE